MRTVAAAYCIAIGVFMVAWWSLDLRRGALRRGDRTPVEIGLHLGAELATAAMLVVGGVVFLTTDARNVALVALGMLLYTVIQSPGYFVARNEHAQAAMFGVLLILNHWRTGRDRCR
jgi:ribose/xylose/arabinose/galactoside ABC-type transport system permease subunit